jgi:hypothetical protein
LRRSIFLSATKLMLALTAEELAKSGPIGNRAERALPRARRITDAIEADQANRWRAKSETWVRASLVIEGHPLQRCSS